MSVKQPDPYPLEQSALQNTRLDAKRSTYVDKEYTQSDPMINNSIVSYHDPNQRIHLERFPCLDKQF